MSIKDSNPPRGWDAAPDTRDVREWPEDREVSNVVSILDRLHRPDGVIGSPPGPRAA